VLELGSGCGLSGLGMMIKGSKVTMTDLDCVINELTIKNSEVASLITYVIYLFYTTAYLRFRKFSLN
jgi:hypothetical protein